MKTKEFIKALDDDRIAAAIGAAEKTTSGEIRVFVTERSVNDVIAEAEKQFVRLRMAETADRNGVLIYFAPVAQKFAVIGDKGVHERCGPRFWEQITSEMGPLLKASKFTEAIVLAVEQIGRVLAREFPWKEGDLNELPNRVERDSDSP